jgi:hypothetical protein
LKKDEIYEKLKKAEFIGGFKQGKLLEDRAILEKAEKELKTEFIPEVYDKTMSRMFGEKYYENDEDDDLEKKGKKINMKILHDEDINEE